MDRADPTCGYCASLLYAHCAIFRHGQAFCQLQEQYWDGQVSIEDVYERLIAISTPEQRRQAVAWVDRRVARGWPPVDRDEARANTPRRLGSAARS